MDATGLIIGIPGLVNDCLDLWERVNDFRDFQKTSSVTAKIYDAQKIRLSQWAQSVGIEKGKLLQKHDKRLDDPEVEELVSSVLAQLKDCFQQYDDSILPLGNTAQKAPPSDPSRTNAPAPKTKRKALRWALSSKTRTHERVNQVEALVSVLHNIVPPQGLDGVNASNAKSLDRLDQLLQAHLEATEDRRLRRVEEFIGAPRISFDYRGQASSRAPGTCEWILDSESYKLWAATTDQASCLWVSGPAGHGKSVLCTRIMVQLVEVEQVCVLYCLSGGHASSGGKLEEVPRIWLSQLVRSLPLAMQLISDSAEASAEKLASENQIWSMLRMALALQTNIHLVIDGLDEYPLVGDQRSKFLYRLEQCVSGSRTKLLLVSRREADIELAIAQLQSSFHCQECILDNTVLGMDLEAYAIALVDEKLTSHTTEFRGEIVQTLIQRCDGMFLWIKLQQDRLRSGKSKRELRKVINNAPSGLAKSYDRNICHIIDQDEHDRRRAFTILRFVLYADWPLSVVEMAEILALNNLNSIEDDDELEQFEADDLPTAIDSIYVSTEIIAVCGSLVTVSGTSKDEDNDLIHQSIHLIHETAREPLMNLIATLESPYPSLGCASSHMTMAVDCVRYLLQGSVHGRQDVGWGLWITPYFSRYARYRWDWHLRQVGSLTPKAVEFFADFFTSSYLPHFAAELEQDICDEYSPKCGRAQPSPEDDGAGAGLGSPLYYACALRLPSLIEELCRRDQQVSAHQGGSLDNPAVAVCYGRSDTSAYKIQCIQVLLGLDPHLPDAQVDQGRALGLAFVEGDFETASFLLSSTGAMPRPQWLCGHLAIPRPGTDRLRCLDLLLDYPNFDHCQKSCSGNDIPHISVHTGDLPLVERLHRSGANFLTLNSTGETVLHTAAESDQDTSEVIRWLLKLGIGVDATDDSGMTALHLAARQGNRNGIEELIQANADVNISDQDGVSALDLSAYNGHIECTELLLKSGINVNAIDKHGVTALHGAAVNGHVEVITMLLDHGADHTLKDEDGESPLHRAGSAMTVRKLLDAGADINDRTTGMESTPLHMTIIRKSLETAEMLIQCGADIDAVDARHRSAVYWATVLENAEIVHQLLQVGADINTATVHRSTPLHSAAHAGNAEIARMLLATGHARPHEYVNYETSSLGLAIAGGHLDIVKQILEPGLFPQPPEQKHPLYMAVDDDEYEVASWLLSNGFDTSAQSARDGPILLTAVKAGESCRIIALLLANGADPTLTNSRGMTPLHVAADYDKPDAIRLLLNKCSLNAPDNNGFHPLQHATFRTNLDSIRILLSAGAVINHTVVGGLSALGIAHESRSWDLVLYLYEQGAYPHQETDWNWRIPVLPDGEFAPTYKVFTSIANKLKDGDLSTLQSDIHSLPSVWHKWAKNELLFYAITLCQAEATQLLLDDGADVQAVNAWSLCLMQCAYYWCEDATIPLMLYKHGARLNFRFTGPKLKILHGENLMAMMEKEEITQGAYEFLMDVLKTEEDKLAANDPELLRELRALRDKEDKVFREPDETADSYPQADAVAEGPEAGQAEGEKSAAAQ